MKETVVITDSLSCISPELAEEYDITVVPFHLIVDARDYLDNTFDRGELFARLESCQNPPNTSACTTGEILEAYGKASQRAKSILFITITSNLSADYNAALQAKEMAKLELPDTAIAVVDSRTVTSGTLLVVLAAARAAKEGKSLLEVTNTSRQITRQVTCVSVPETLFFFERAGRSGGQPGIAKAPIPIYPLLEMDASSGGAGKFMAKNRTKHQAIEALLEVVKERSGGKKLHAAISYTNNPDEAEILRDELVSRFEVSELYITEYSSAACATGGPRCLSLGFHG